MFRRWLSGIVGLLVLVSGAGVARAEPDWPGVRYSPPAGMQLTDRWSRDCPAECRMYEGPDDDEWPLIIVHAPILGPAQSAVATYRTGLEARIDAKLYELSFDRRQQDGLQVAMGLFEQRDKWEDPGEGEFSMVAFITLGEVTLPVELKSLNKSGLQERASTFSALLGTVSIDPAEASSGAQAAAKANEGLAKAVAAGYAKGERAVMYMDVDAGIRNEFRVGGLQLIAYRNENRLIFLPGGVFLEPDQEDFDLRNPNIAYLTEEKVLGSWTRSGENYVVKRADGSVTTYRPGKRDGAQKSLTADGKQLYWEISPLKAEDLVGSYASIDTASSGGGTSELAMVASRSDKKLRILPGGRFEMSREGWVGVLGSQVTISTRGGENMVGRYEWDPTSWMITLKGDDGNVRRGPIIPGPGQFTAAERAEGGDWNVLGGTRWWREK